MPTNPELIALFRDMLALLAGAQEPAPGPAVARAATSPSNPDWLLLSTLGQAIVDGLADGPLSSEQLARKIGEAASSRLKNVLADLVDREVLRVTRDGYAVNRPRQEQPR